MDWEPIEQFIVAADPAFAAAVQGVSHEEIQRVEREQGIQLPRSYRGFVQMMGRDAGGLELFPFRNQRFDDLAVRLPAATYPGQDYFKIAIASDPSEISPPDYFLDLTRSDGRDAPIVSFEDDEDRGLEDFDPGRVHETPFTFGEQAANSVFTHLVLRRASEHARIVIAAMTDPERRAAFDEVAALFGVMRFEAAFRPDSRVLAFRRGEMAALVNRRDDLHAAMISLGGDDGTALKVVVEQVLERFPDAAARGAGGSFGR